MTIRYEFTNIMIISLDTLCRCPALLLYLNQVGLEQILTTFASEMLMGYLLHCGWVLHQRTLRQRMWINISFDKAHDSDS